MAIVVRAALSRAVKAGTFGKGLGYDSSKTSGGETLDARDDIASSETAAAADATTALAAHATAALAAAVHALPKVTLANGTAAATDVTVTGMAVGDTLISVLSFSTAAAIATVADRTSEYAVQAGGLDKAAGTDESGNQLVIFWNDAT